MASEVTGSGSVKRKGSGNPTPKPEFGGCKVPSGGEVSGSGDSGTRTYLVLNMGEGVVSGHLLDDRHEVGDRWVINFHLIGLESDPIIVH